VTGSPTRCHRDDGGGVQVVERHCETTMMLKCKLILRPWSIIILVI